MIELFQGAYQMIKIYLSKLLGERRISQLELARRTGIRPATINEIYWEFAERINLEHIDLICKTLGCRIVDFMEVVYENNDEKIN